ncbi:hypothetical protein [Paenibacillus prosopidis]|uniref:C1q domain-containing protein n=1 Tax=Paenibacillus prosopidis TaxID=630520 RepID=A0A368VUI5_9BACL|nr:hypothetical protein [Paenibacillus prosopidis]RCW45525.1 hypothetical protein DFP97_110113 [Paenibacillus prosopidis]
MAIKRLGEVSGTKKRVCKKRVCKKRVCKPFKKSAFRAVSGTDQTLLDDETAKVRYQVQELDLNNEYNPATSTFRPKHDGVYSLFASVFFEIITRPEVIIGLEIRVNGAPKISDQEIRALFGPQRGIIDASGIVQLEARDRVEVFATFIGENAEIQSGVATRFEGARIT